MYPLTKRACFSNLVSTLSLSIAFVAPLSGFAETTTQAVSAQVIAQQLDSSNLNFDQLHTYSELVQELYDIEANSNGMIDVGPLIFNGDNGGLINIDVPYSGAETIRSAVVNTVATDSVSILGNSNPDNVGLSNKGRAIMAARFGHGTTKLVYITQQHGNEFIETEAAFDFLTEIASLSQRSKKELAKKISVLMIVRANPDGGEPNPAACQMATPFPPPQNPTYDCAFYRFNIDKTAGTLPTADAFKGAVGVGYNLNRYHIPQLDAPIRPVEAQAMVAAILAFKPNYIMDLHGDMPKVTCVIDQSSVNPVVPGLLYDANCASETGSRVNAMSVRDMAESLDLHDATAQRWNGIIANTLRFFGVQVGRHRQFNESNDFLHTAGDYAKVNVEGEPIHTMLLEMRNLAPVADPMVATLDFSQSPPAPKVEFALNHPLGDENFATTKFLSEVAMMNSLLAITTKAVDQKGDAGYKKIPKDSGFIYELSPITMKVLGLEHPGPFLFPLCTFETCLGE